MMNNIATCGDVKYNIMKIFIFNVIFVFMIIYGKIDSETLTSIFNSVIDQIEYQKVIRVDNNSEIAIIAGSKYFFTTNDRIGFLLVSYYDGTKQQIDINMVGGQVGLLESRWGRGKKEIKEILEQIKKEAENKGFKCEL